jgi:hypothetical protein
MEAMIVCVCDGFFQDRVSSTIYESPDLCLLSCQNYRREPLTQLEAIILD